MNKGMLPLKQVAGRSILFAMAAAAEYGPRLRNLIRPLMTGVGPVEAGIAVARGLAQQFHRGELPDLVVSLGSAGSRTLQQTVVYQVSSVSYRDMDATALGFAQGVTPFLELPATVSLPFRIPGLPQASLSTGGNIVSGSAYDVIGRIWWIWKPSPSCVPASTFQCH